MSERPVDFERRGANSGPPPPMRRRVRIAGLALAGAGVLWSLACGGGSPTDVVQPASVQVSVEPSVAASPGTVGLELAAAIGRDVRIDVVARELDEATGIAFELSFDPAFVEFTGVSTGGYFGAGSVAGAAEVAAVRGRIVGVAAAADQKDGRSGSGTLLTLAFRLEDLRDAEMPLTFVEGESRVYDAAGMADQPAFSGARLVTRILSSP